MKKVTIKEAAECLGLIKVGTRYFDEMYVDGFVGYSGLPFGVEPVYLSDGVYLDPGNFTGKEVLEKYKEYISKHKTSEAICV